MHTVGITIRRGAGGCWPVELKEEPADGGMPVRTDGQLIIDPQALDSAAPQDYGVQLGEALFREGIGNAFQRALRGSLGQLHIHICIEDDGLKSWRWERLCAPIDGGRWQALALDQRVPFSIRVDSETDLTYAPAGRGGVRALIVVACPRGLEQWQLAEFDALAAVGSARAGLGPIPSDVLGPTGDAIGPPSLDGLCQALTDRRYTLLHIVAHGRFRRDDHEPVVLLQGTDDAGVDPVAASRLVERLARVGGSRGLPRFVFLASCEAADPRAEGALGGLGRRLERDLGVHAVLAMTDRVTVRTVLALSKVFYARLLAHGKPDLALPESYASLAERSDVAVPVPALFSRASGRPLFDQEPGPDPFTAATAIAPTLATTVVDHMRLLSVAVSDDAREANKDRYQVFLELAQYHFNDLRSLLAQLPDKLDPSLREISVKLQRKLSWAYLNLRGGPRLSGNPNRFFKVMNDVIELSNQFFANSEEHVGFREIVQDLVTDLGIEAAADINSAVRARLLPQERALQHPYVEKQARIRSIIEALLEVEWVDSTPEFLENPGNRW
jgi:hypothetical protein